MLNSPAASAAPVPPAQTSACARPSATARAACTIEASGVARAARAGSPLLAIETGASISSTPSGSSAGAIPSSETGPNSNTRAPCSAASTAPAATSAGPRSAPFASTATTTGTAALTASPPRHRRRYSSWWCSSGCVATISRPAYVPHTGHTRCGRRGLWQRGHTLSAGAVILCCARRLAVRLCDCFCLGTAIGRKGYQAPPTAESANAGGGRRRAGADPLTPGVARAASPSVDRARARDGARGRPR